MNDRIAETRFPCIYRAGCNNAENCQRVGHCTSADKETLDIMQGVKQIVALRAADQRRCDVMTEVRLSEERVAENELICEKLLGWKRLMRGSGGWQRWTFAPQYDEEITPTFEDWNSVGLILHALQISTIGLKGDPRVDAAIPLIKDLSERLALRLLGLPAIRNAAVAYVRSLP